MSSYCQSILQFIGLILNYISNVNYTIAYIFKNVSLKSSTFFKEYYSDYKYCLVVPLFLIKYSAAIRQCKIPGGGVIGATTGAAASPLRPEAVQKFNFYFSILNSVHLKQGYYDSTCTSA